MNTVIVEPVDGGWTVNIDGVDNPMVFRSGRAAELAGRDLAMRLAQGEHSVRLELRLRGGAVAARFMVLPPIGDDDDPLMIDTPTVSGADRLGDHGEGLPLLTEGRNRRDTVSHAPQGSLGRGSP